MGGLIAFYGMAGKGRLLGRSFSYLAVVNDFSTKLSIMFPKCSRTRSSDLAHEWMFETLKDLRDHAVQSNLPELAALLKDVEALAVLEISNLPVGKTALDMCTSG